MAVPIERLVAPVPYRGPQAEGHPALVSASWDGHNPPS
jgi:hypothetical protein